MAYESVDKLQKVLVKDVFHYAKDTKKAAGRALGTLVEIVTYYLLKSWGLNNNISIEKGLAEYGNPEITHNVEYSLHPELSNFIIKIPKDGKSITSDIIIKELQKSNFPIDVFSFNKSNKLLSKDLILRNACTIGNSSNSYLLCSIEKYNKHEFEIRVYEQLIKPFAVFECKRVGVEEGNKKGPQTIEKAKQGAYVARSVSSLQKIRTETGLLQGIIYKSDGSIHTKPYIELMEEVIYSSDKELLRKFILTVGVVSNHGNWFTSDNPNKELKVLSQSYDWLLFLTDFGLSRFVEKLILKNQKKYKPIKDAFISSYNSESKVNQFTKVKMNFYADGLLLDFFKENIDEIEKWFNIISPKEKSLNTLKSELTELKNKKWIEILK